VAIYPSLSLPGDTPCVDANCTSKAAAWWQSSPHDFLWWQSWFEHYRTFLLNYTDLANQSGAEVLVIGGSWILPALPGGHLPDGNSSGVPDDAEQMWRSIITDIRARFSGTLLWAMPFNNEQEGFSTPPFIDLVDGIYLEWSAPLYDGQESTSSIEDLKYRAGMLLDNVILPAISDLGLPLWLSIRSISVPDLQIQADIYQAFLEIVNNRPWVNGFISSGYFPPVSVQDTSASVNGKPSAELLRTYWPIWGNQNP
jgi:hypothetical protein